MVSNCQFGTRTEMVPGYLIMGCAREAVNKIEVQLRARVSGHEDLVAYVDICDIHLSHYTGWH